MSDTAPDGDNGVELQPDSMATAVFGKQRRRLGMDAELKPREAHVIRAWRQAHSSAALLR